MYIRIFLSAVSDEFQDYREALRHDLTRHDVEVKIQEDFKDLGGVTLDKLDRYIAGCDAVIHLVGDMPGSAPMAGSTQVILARYPKLAEMFPPLREALNNRQAISYTQWEAWLALYHGKVLLIAEANDGASRGPKYSRTDASRAAQQAHLARLRAVERYPGFTFTSTDNLAKQIAYTVILDLLAGRTSVAGSMTRNYQRKIKAFLDEYLVSEAGNVPFGGRDRELERLDAWLADQLAAPRMLITAPAGRGKSALLVPWMKSLQDRGLVTTDGWQIAFMPISIRVGTNRPSDFLGGLAHPLRKSPANPLRVKQPKTPKHSSMSFKTSLKQKANACLSYSTALTKRCREASTPPWYQGGSRAPFGFFSRRAGRSGTSTRPVGSDGWDGIASEPRS